MHDDIRLTSHRKAPLDAAGREDIARAFAFENYFEHVEAASRRIRSDKRGAIPTQTPKLLDRSGIATDQFIVHVSTLLQQFGSAVGTPAQLAQLGTARSVEHLSGTATALEMFERKARGINERS